MCEAEKGDAHPHTNIPWIRAWFFYFILFWCTWSWFTIEATIKSGWFEMIARIISIQGFKLLANCDAAMYGCTVVLYSWKCRYGGISIGCNCHLAQHTQHKRISIWVLLFAKSSLIACRMSLKWSNQGDAMGAKRVAISKSHQRDDSILHVFFVIYKLYEYLKFHFRGVLLDKSFFFK